MRQSLRPVLLALLLFSIQATLLAPLVEEIRTDTGIAYEQVPGLEVPADIRILEGVLGSFRGWLINFLWLRAGQLQEEDRIHESMQLSRWITRLQPHYPQVWVHQAWNLAFNLSQSATTSAEQYIWIESGISLLRDDGIPINRNAWKLYEQLAFIHWFKLGDASRDETREYYWRRFFAEWHAWLGAPSGQTARERAAWLSVVAEAPPTLAEVLEEYPGLEEEELISLIQSEPREFLAAIALAERGSGPLASWLAKTDRVSARQALVAQVRAQVLRDIYHMDPLLMVELTKALGPIDWRHPAAHALYWAAQGVLRIETGEAYPRLNKELLSRLYRNHAFAIGLQQLVLRGRLTGDPSRMELRHSPEYRFLTAYESTIFNGLVTEEGPGPNATLPEEYQIAYWNIVEASLLTAWLRGDIEVAERCLERLHRFFGDSGASPIEFLMVQLEDGLPEGETELTAEISFRIREQLFEGLRGAAGDLTNLVWLRRRELAERLWNKFSGIELAIPDIESLEEEAVEGFFRASTMYASAASKARLWDHIAPEQRAEFSLPLIEQLKDEARRAGLDPSATFNR